MFVLSICAVVSALCHGPSSAVFVIGEGDAVKVERLRIKLGKVSSSLVALIGSRSSISATSTVAELQAFSTELEVSLEEARTERDATKALQKLSDAEAGVRSLIEDMTQTQIDMLKRTPERRQSLLLGLLMAKRKSPFGKQMQLLEGETFKDLPVAQAVLSTHDGSMPLYLQVASYLDAHAANGSQGKHEGKADLKRVAGMLEKRLLYLSHVEGHLVQLHQQEMHDLAAEANLKSLKASGLEHHIRSMMKASDEKYAQEASADRAGITSLQSTIEAIKSGDVKKLRGTRREVALQNKNVQNELPAMLELIRLGHHIEGADCVVCSAQCLNTCHAARSAYTGCVGKCAGL